MMKCTNCGQELKQGEKNCFNCGAVVITEKNACQSCGKVNPPSAKFCRFCGRTIVKPKSQTPTLQGEGAEEKAVPEPIKEATSDEKGRVKSYMATVEVSNTAESIVEKDRHILPDEHKHYATMYENGYEREASGATKERVERKLSELAKLRLKRTYTIISVILALLSVIMLCVSGMTHMNVTDGVEIVTKTNFFEIISPQRVYDLMDEMEFWRAIDENKAIGMLDEVIVQMFISGLSLTAVIVIAALIVILVIRIVKFTKDPDANVGCIASKIFLIVNLTTVFYSAMLAYSETYDSNNYIIDRLSLATILMMIICGGVFFVQTGVGMVARNKEKMNGFAIAIKINLMLMMAVTIIMTWLLGTGAYRIRYDEMNSTSGSMKLQLLTTANLKQPLWMDFLTASIGEQVTIALYLIICIFLLASIYTGITSGKGILATTIFSGILAALSLAYFMFSAMLVNRFLAVNTAEINVNMISSSGMFILIGGAVVLVLGVLMMAMHMGLRTKYYKEQKEMPTDIGRYTR